jgi:hypothetical protein
MWGERDADQPGGLAEKLEALAQGVRIWTSSSLAGNRRSQDGVVSGPEERAQMSGEG